MFKILLNKIFPEIPIGDPMGVLVRPKEVIDHAEYESFSKIHYIISLSVKVHFFSIIAALCFGCSYYFFFLHDMTDIIKLGEEYSLYHLTWLMAEKLIHIILPLSMIYFLSYIAYRCDIKEDIFCNFGKNPPKEVVKIFKTIPMLFTLLVTIWLTINISSAAPALKRYFLDIFISDFNAIPLILSSILLAAYILSILIFVQMCLLVNFIYKFHSPLKSIKRKTGQNGN